LQSVFEDSLFFGLPSSVFCLLNM